MKKLYISEKPDMTRKFLSLPMFRGGKHVKGSTPYYGYVEGNTWVHSWTIGHLAQLFKPADYDPKYKKWAVEDLPIIPVPAVFKRKPIAETKEQFEIIISLMNRSDISSIVCCTDAGREGELIFRELYWMANCTKPIERIFVSATDDDTLIHAFQNLEPGQKYDLLAASADARDITDLLVGDTLTRGYSVKLGRLLPLGRVMTVLLAEIYQREETIQNFVPQNFYELFVTFDQVEAKWEPSHKERILDKIIVQQILEKTKNRPAVVTGFKKITRKSQPPLLYNLTDLSKECVRKFGWSAAKTLDVLQSLYAPPLSLVTYPRTDSRHLPTSMVQDVLDTL